MKVKIQQNIPMIVQINRISWRAKLVQWNSLFSSLKSDSGLNTITTVSLLKVWMVRIHHVAKLNAFRDGLHHAGQRKSLNTNFWWSVSVLDSQFCLMNLDITERLFGWLRIRLEVILAPRRMQKSWGGSKPNMSTQSEQSTRLHSKFKWSPFSRSLNPTEDKGTEKGTTDQEWFPLPLLKPLVFSRGSPHLTAVRKSWFVSKSIIHQCRSPSPKWQR